MKNRFPFWTLLLSGILFCLSIGWVLFFLSNQTYMKSDFDYYANIISFDNFYNEAKGEFSGEILSNTRFSYEIDKDLDEAFIIKNVFDVRKPSGEPIFAVTRFYGITKKTGQHIAALGDNNRSGFLFGPANADKNPFTYWHINYNVPAQMNYIETVEINGLELYLYESKFKADQTQNLTYLPAVPEIRGVELDINLKLWIVPETGRMVKYEDFTTAYFYDIKTKKRLTPWNQFHNEFDGISIASQIEISKLELQRRLWNTVFIPASFLAIICVILLIGYKTKTQSHWKTYMTVAFIAVVGVSSSLLVSEYLTQTTSVKQQYMYNEEYAKIRLNIQKEIDKNLEILYSLKANFLRSPKIKAEGFKHFANHYFVRNPHLISLLWVPQVKGSERKTFEEQIQKYTSSARFIWEKNNKEVLKSRDKNEFYPILLIEPEEVYHAARGFDISSLDVYNNALHIAKNTGQFVVTERLVFSKTIVGLNGMFVIIPVFNEEMGFEHSEEAYGFFIAVYSLEGIVEGIVNTPLISKNIQIMISDQNTSGNSVLYQSQMPPESSFQKASNLQVANRIWKLHFFANKNIPDVYKPMFPSAVPLIGTFFTVIICYITYRILSENKKELLNKNQMLKVFTKELKEKNEELEQFIYLSSHDFQEPLNTIVSFVNLLKENYAKGLDQEGLNYLTYISDAGWRLKLLFKEVLDYTMIGKDKEESDVNLNRVLTDIISEMTATIAKTETQLHVDVLPTLRGYENEIKQLFINLLNNAMTFRRPGKVPLISISSKLENGISVLSVRDNGIGIDPKYHNKVFLIFQRFHEDTTYTGNGIGLTHCKKIVELHKGKMWFESELGKGTTFYFTLQEDQV